MSALDEEYGCNVGRFILDHDDCGIKIGPMNIGYQAQKRGPDGHGVGERHLALTLDELAAKLRTARSTPRR